MAGFVATAPCGCAYMATAIRVGMERENARAVAEAIREGARVDRVENDDEVRAMLVADCPHTPKWGGI